MVDFATPNLPARSFEETSGFYARLGFVEAWRDDGWMILRRGALQLEFFPDAGVDPLASSAGCCLRVDDLDGLYAQCLAAGIAEARIGQPRLHPPKREAWGGRVAYLVDPSGTLVRMVENL